MRTRRVGLLVLILALGCASSAAAMDVLEAGVRIDLALQPLRIGSAVHWDFAVGGYALVRLNEGWRGRATLGYDVLNAGPYLGLGLARSVTTGVLLEGDVTFQWDLGRRSSVARLDAGVRLASASGSAQPLSLGLFPASWTLDTITGQLSSFSFSPSFEADGALVLGTGLLVGEAVSATFLRVPALGDQPVWPLGGGWMLAARFTTRFGYVPAAW